MSTVAAVSMRMPVVRVAAVRTNAPPWPRLRSAYPTPSRSWGAGCPSLAAVIAQGIGVWTLQLDVMVPWVLRLVLVRSASGRAQRPGSSASRRVTPSGAAWVRMHDAPGRWSSAIHGVDQGVHCDPGRHPVTDRVATGAVAAIGEISAIIASINDFQLTIASAVEEQTATTNEMSRGVAEAAAGSGEIAVNITGVASAADSSAHVLGQMGDAVTELARLSTDLRTRMSTFTY